RVTGRDERHLASELSQLSDRVLRPLLRPALSCEDERAHVLVDRREMPVQELLGLVRGRVDPGALAKLEGCLLRSGPVAAGADDEHALLPERVDAFLKRM